MPVHSGLLRLRTGGHGEVVDLTEGVRSVLGTSGVALGVATVFAPGATVAITTMEYEPGAVADLAAVLERLIPAQGPRRLRAQPPQPRLQRPRASAGRPHRPVGVDPDHRWPARARDLAADRPARLRRPPARAHGQRADRLLMPGGVSPRRADGRRMRRRGALHCALRHPVRVAADACRRRFVPDRRQALYWRARPKRAPSGAGPTWPPRKRPFRRGDTVFENSTACALAVEPRPRCASRFDLPPGDARVCPAAVQRVK